MEHLRIIRDIEMKKYKPIYFLMGEEPYFIDQISDAIQEKILSESERAFGETVVYGRDVSMDQVLMLAKSYPMMGSHQVIIVKEAQDIKEWKKADDLQSFEAYVSSPTPSTILVFCHKYKTLDKRLKIFKTLQKTAEVFESKKISDYKLPDWISSYVQSKGLKMGNDASLLLSEYLGNDLHRIVNEVNKLTIVVPAGTAITTDSIEKNIGISKDYNVWELQKAIGKKDVLKANKIIDYFQSNPKAHPIQMTVPSLFGFFNKLNLFVAYKDNPDVCKIMGIPPFSLNDYKEAARNYNLRKVESIISYLREADKRSKGIGAQNLSSEDIMRELIFKILH
jgi:DNA polymerase III subunit delta